MGMMLNLLWLAVPGYIVLQVFAVALHSGRARLAAAVPLLVMVPLFVYASIGLARDSNLWPLPILFASPVAMAYAALFVFGVPRHRAPLADGTA